MCHMPSGYNKGWELHRKVLSGAEEDNSTAAQIGTNLLHQLASFYFKDVKKSKRKKEGWLIN